MPQPDLDAQRDEAPLRHVDVLLEHMMEEKGLEDVHVRAGEMNMHQGAETGDKHLRALPVGRREEEVVVTVDRRAVRLHGRGRRRWRRRLVFHDVVFPQHALDKTSHALAQRVQPIQHLLLQHLHARHPRAHADDVVVERARVAQDARARIEHAHDLPTSSERAETHAAAHPFPQRHQVRPDGDLVAQAAVSEPGGHDLVEDEKRAGLGGRGAEEAQEGVVAGDGAAGAEHGFDEDGGEGVGGDGVEDGAGGGDVVVGGQDEVVGEVEARFGGGVVGF